MGTGCSIVSMTSPSASTLKVVWSSYAGASIYSLDLRVVNSTTVAPVVVLQSAPSTQRLIQGLRPGHVYEVILKVFEFYSVVCTVSEITMTVPAMSQITYSKAISSTSIKFEWSSVMGADSYSLFVEELFSFPQKRFNQTLTSLGGQMDGLTPATTYNCYVYSVNSAGRGAKSNTRTIMTLVQPPTGVALVATGKSTATVTWNKVNKVLLYQVVVSDNDNASNPPVIRNTSSTTMDISNLEPCSTYTVGVSSVNVFLVPGEASNITHTTSTINPVTTVSVDYSCSNGMVTVTWNQVFGANTYRATAVDGTGASLNCTSASSSCQITMLKCGEKYRVHVTAISDDCESTSNTSSLFETVPCAPANPQTIHTCSSNVIVFSWQPTNNTLYYVATAVDKTGKVTECRTPDNTCYFTNTGCGQFYTYNVYAVSSECNSEVSQPEFVRTSPCLPTNVRTGAGCHSDMLITTWDSAAGALSYTVEAQGNTGETYNCTSSSNSCAVTGVPCGEHLSVWIVASNDNCSTSRVLGEIAQTVPCSPQTVSASVECSQDSARVNWTTSIGAVFYIAVAQDANGNSHSCNSVGTSCLIEGLACGQNYTASVVGTNFECNSTINQEISFRTAPCPPTNIEAFRDCDANHALIVWQNRQLAGLYTATIEDQSGAQLSCTNNTANYCKISSLPCGRKYNVTVTYNDGNCPSTSTPISMYSAPCSPSIQNRTLICGTNSSFLSWLPMADATGYTVNATAANGHKVSCSSANASCTLTDLLCSETYVTTVTARGNQCDSLPGASTNITTAITSKQFICGTNTAVLGWTDPVGSLGFFAQAQGAQCNSSVSVSESLETVPCAPKNVSATLMCSNRSALVTWVGSPSAVGYNVTATGQDGHTHPCNTNSTSCQVSDIHCGETYSITVTPYSHTCTGNPSAAYSFTAGLCAPTNVMASAACADSVVSWLPVAGADMYIATATSGDGHNHTCSSNSSNSCNFTDLHCGEAYTVTVVTVDRGCPSDPSSAAVLTTALCPPADLMGHVSCDANTQTLTWTPVTGATYVLLSEWIGGTFPPAELPTPNPSLMLSDLPCGQRFAFRIAAQDGQCRSSYSPPIEISTAPCQPTNLTARVDCGTNRGNFSWVDSSGAAFYTVEVTGENGHVASCSSNQTSCAVKLQCGRSYSASLVASTESCNSTKHTDIHFESAPCLPEDVLAELDCNANVMNVSWTLGSDDYTAWAISTDGHRASCNSTSNSCSIHDLQCGKIYEVAVTSSSIHCQVIAGSDYKIQSAPCKPENTSVDQNCSSNAVTVKWNQASTTQNYTVKAASASGVNSTCDSTQSSCSFLDLSCGQRYTFTVMGHTNVCMSEISAPVEMVTAPCPPGSVSAELNCTTRNALVSWSNAAAAAAATAYSVQATSTNGHNSSCSEMGSSCSLNNLVCGQEYSVVVEAMHSGCPGPASAPATVTTEPCVPMNLSVHYNVSTAQAMWSAASGATSYSVEAVTDQGLTVICNNTNTSCFLMGVQCGQSYSVTVKAHNQACDSVTSETFHLLTEPCPPTNVQAGFACKELTATVSWQQSDLAVGYVAYFDNQNGHDTSCAGTSTDTSCVVSGLMCGTVYSAWVKALGQKYNSSDSSVVSVTSGPCQPSSIEAVVDCQARSAVVSWLPAIGADFYVAALKASSGHISSCITNHTNCEPSPLQCGQEYNVTVMALGDICNSSAVMTGYLSTEPCVPMNVSVHYNVSTAQATWSAASGATSYSVEAVTAQGLTVICNTTNTSCFLMGVQCGQIYNVTVKAHNQACNNTVTSAAYRLMTEPCPPTSVQPSMACEQLAAIVSWQQSDLAVGYVAYFDNRNGHDTSCTSTNTDTFCTVSGLMCGTVYSVWVKALGQKYNSSDSSVVSLTSAPCLPQEIQVDVDCNSDGAAVVSWNATHGTANYSLMAVVVGNLQTLCTTQQGACNVTGLSCGETYNLSLTASNEECSLTAQTHANLTTRPCPPRRVAANLQCGSRTAVLSWEERSDVELYVGSAVKASGGEVRKCNSTGSSCQFAGLDCGETYNLTITAHVQGCRSQASTTAFIQTEPCQPVIVSAQAVCQSDEVQISWNQANDVLSYLVTATGSLGYVEIHNTTQTLLSATLPCGQNYSVTVQVRGSECDSSPSSPAFFKTTPCIPWDVATYVECEFNVGSVSWGPSDGAEEYVAVATGLDGHPHQCLTNTTSCTWSDLHCGEEYTVVVRAKGDSCTSLPSNSSVIHMDPCVPQNLAAAVNCNADEVSLSWNAGNGTKTYMVSAEAGDTSVHFSTNVTTATFSELTCGQNYNLTVTPHNQHCPGNYSASAFVQTWPCPPMGVSTRQDCLSGVVMVTWQPSNGSDYYSAIMQTNAGPTEMCMSETSQCSIPGLACGHNFSVSVTASNQQCNVTSSQTTSLLSVPCVPTNVLVVMDCANNTAAVSWSASRGAVQYSVTALGSHSNDSCQSSGLSCSLRNLTCGSSYTVQVVAMDDDCSSIPSQALVFNSGPCPPQNVNAQVSCSSNDMTVSWDAVGDADHFLVSITAENGGTSELCNTTNTACSISNATCGDKFTVHVSSVRGDCRSRHSLTQSIQSAPCQPQGLTGRLDCVTNSAWITWDAAPGVDSYFVSAAGGEEHTANCTTSNATVCEVEDLACGVLYNFSVTAKNSRCDSPPSAAIELQTAPCSLSGITAFTQCHNSTILVIWELMEGSEGSTLYIATAEASDHTYLSCNSTGTSCYLHGAQCDLHYTIIVAASSDRCSSMRSPPYRVSMEPCPPRDVMVNSSCEDRRALVSWTPSPVAETYHVVTVATDGHVRTCNTSSSNCSMSELQCDQQYTVSVTASHENCSSKASQNTTVNTGPCQPSGLSLTFHCTNQSATLTWTPSDNAVDYYGCAQAGNGDMLYCHSTNPSCTINSLDCGTVYNFSVQASDGTCNSSSSDPLQGGAAPCPPDAIEVQLLPMQMEIQVMQFSWTAVSCGNTDYLLALTGSLLGDSQALFEISSYWTSRTNFEIPLPCGSSYDATVQSRNSAGTSSKSVPLSGTTAPCPPAGVVYSNSSSLTTVSWSASVFATMYTVYDNSVTPRTQLCSVAGLSCSLSNIASNDLVITASNAAGESEETRVTTGKSCAIVG
ncbi:mucin-19 [Stegastes partitus]|uniref:Mucin-19 n=1 Tax=Stegastes partitus TaxID=144197 RepID=A0A9Y4JQD8_9TELE|nr:PREDICTED: mucin-19-like [Stegastes partitus]